MSGYSKRIFASSGLDAADRWLLLKVLEEWLAEGFSSNPDERVTVARWAIELDADPEWIKYKVPEVGDA